MDIVNFPGIIAEHGLLSSAQVDLAKDLILIGKKMGVQRDGTQYENMAITVAQFANLIGGGGNQTLAQTLALGNVTGGNNIVISNGDNVTFNSGAFSGGLTTLALTGNQTWSLPNQSGTIALLSDLPDTLYSANGTVGTNRVATLTDILTFANGTTLFTYSNGPINLIAGFGADPVGFGQDGWAANLTTAANNSFATVQTGTGGSETIMMTQSLTDQVCHYTGDNFFAPGTIHSAMYWTDGTLFTGLSASSYGEKLASQAFGLVTTTPTPADGVLFSTPAGIIKVTTYTDLATQLAIPTFYTSNGSTTGVRTVTLGSDLIFQFASLEGSLQLTDGGGFFLRTSDPQDSVIFFPDGTTDYLAVNTENLVSMGFRTTHTIGGTVDSFAELITSDDSRAYLNISIDTTRFDFWTNNKSTYAGGILGATGAWGIGGLGENSSSLLVTGKGNTTATNSQRWVNLGGTDLGRMTDNGVLCIGATTPSSYLGTAQRLHIDGSISTDYSPSVIVNQTYSPTVNNGNSSSSAVFAIYKANAFNTLEMRGIFAIARNDGSGSLTYMYGIESFVYNIGTATINSAFAYSARCQIRDGVVTNWGGLDISYQENGAPAVITNMIGVFVRTPTNVLGITVTNTYGMLIHGNSIGTNNYAFASDGKATSGLGTITPNQQTMLHIRANHNPVFKAHTYFEPITAANASTITPSDGMQVYVSDTNGTFTAIGFWGYENGVWIKL